MRSTGSGVVACRLQSTDSEVVAHRLSCPTAYEIFPDQRSNLCPPAVASEFLSTVPPGKSSLFLLSRAWVSLMEKSLAFHVHIKYNFCYGSTSHKGGSRERECVEAWRDFPGGPVVKTLPSNAGDMGLIPGWGARIPHTARCCQIFFEKRRGVWSKSGWFGSANWGLCFQHQGASWQRQGCPGEALSLGAN